MVDSPSHEPQAQPEAQPEGSASPNITWELENLFQILTVSVVSIASNSSLKRWQLPTTIDSDRFVLVRAGRARLTIGQYAYNATAGRILLAPAGTVAQVRHADAFRVDEFSCRINISQDVSLCRLFPPPLCIEGGGASRAAQIISEVNGDFDRDPRSYISSLAAALQLVRLFYRADENDIVEPETVDDSMTTGRYTGQQLLLMRDSVSKMIDASRQGRDLSAQELAEAASMSRSNFTRVFTEVTGTAPAAFLRRVRMDRACEWLRNTPETIAAVGEAVGYPDPYHFSRVFRSEIGVSPTDYRARVAGGSFVEGDEEAG